MEKVADFTQFEEKKTHTSLCIIVHLCTIATVTMHICTVTIALPFNILMFLFIILMLYSYGIKAPFSHFFSLSFHWATPTPQLVSPCFIPELFLSSSLFVCFLSALAHCHHHRKLCDRFGVFVALWGGWINLEVSLLGFGAIFSKKRYEFFSLRF